MAEMQPTMEILKKIRKNSGQNKDEVFTRLYRYMLRKDLYYLAYQNLYANQGAAKMLWEHQKRCKEEYGYRSDWFVFGGEEPLSDQTIRRRLNEYADKAGVKKIRVHDIRHSHASLLINKGQNILIVSQRLGHSDVTQTLNTYSHLMPNVQKQIINALDFEM